MSTVDRTDTSIFNLRNFNEDALKLKHYNNNNIIIIVVIINYFI